MKVIFALPLFVALLISCGSDDPEGDISEAISSEYIIINNLIDNGIISTYNSATKILMEDVVDFAETNSVFIQDAAYKDGNLFLSTTNPPTLRKIAMEEKTQVNKTLIWAPWAFVVPFGNKAVACSRPVGYVPNDEIMTVNIYDENLVLLDSLVDEGVIQIHAVAMVGNNLFCSVLVKNVGPFIHVFDMDTKTMTKAIPTSSLCWQFLQLNGNQLLGIENNTFNYINTVTLDVINKKSVIPVGSAEVAYRASRNLLYILSPAAQPAVYAYRLYSINMETDELTLLVAEQSINKPMIYDEKREALVTGGMKIFSTEGKVLEEVEIPLNPLRIFVR